MKSFRASLWTEGNIVVAQCLDVDVASQGLSEAEALENLREALHLHFSNPTADVLPKVQVVEVDLGAA